MVFSVGLTRIRIENLELDCLIGVWPHEREQAQRVRVDLTIDVDTQRAILSDDLADTVNYDWLADSVRFILQSGRFRLLESAVACVQRWVLMPPLTHGARPAVQNSTIRITKYDAFPDQTLAIVESTNQAGDFTYEHEQKTWGSVDVIAETAHVGFYRLNIRPGQELPLHYHTYMREQEWVVEGRLALLEEGREPTILTTQQWIEFPMEHRHGYRNIGEVTASLLCMDSPPFNHDDEILVSSS